MARRNDSWGIEVGASAIKAVRLVRTGKEVDLAEYDVLPFKQVLTTPDLNVDEAVQVNLDALLSRHDLSHSNVVVSVPGHLAFARFAKLPPVEPKKIPDIVRFEAVQQIPFPIDQVEWDYQVFQQEESPDVEVGIFAITKERVMTFLSNYRQMGMRIDALTLSPLAVYNAFAYENAEDPDREGTIYMDIGAASTDVIVVEHGGIWLRTLPMGGNNFTEALVKAFKLSFSKAERLKREAGTSKYARQIFQAMRPVFADLVQEMQRSIGYYQSLNRDAELTRLVGVGSTFRLPGLTKFLKQQLQVEVIRPDGYKRIAVEGKQEADFAHHALNLATAYGLALQGVGLESVSANILPSAILRQRLWKAKQPWIMGAAACLAVAAGLAGGRYFMENAAWQSANTSIDRAVQPVISEAQGYVSQWQKVSEGSDPRVKIENLRRILDYRGMWPKLWEDVSAALASLQPQAATLSSNYVEMEKIPASQRRRFYIQKVTSQYEVGAPLTPGIQPSATPSAGVTPQTKISGKFTPTDFWNLSADEADSPKAPRFVITLTGTTPHTDAVRFISEHFIKWFVEHAKQPNRPYTFSVSHNAITRTWQITPEQQASERQQTPAGPMWNRGPRGYGAPVPENYGPDMMYPPGGYGVPDMSMSQSHGNEPLLPQRPTPEEPVTQTGFEIQFTVKLVPPDEARRGEGVGEPAASPLPPQARTNHSSSLSSFSGNGEDARLSRTSPTKSQKSEIREHKAVAGSLDTSIAGSGDQEPHT